MDMKGILLQNTLVKIRCHIVLLLCEHVVFMSLHMKLEINVQMCGCEINACLETNFTYVLNLLSTILERRGERGGGGGLLGSADDGTKDD